MLVAGPSDASAVGCGIRPPDLSTVKVIGSGLHQSLNVMVLTAVETVDNSADAMRDRETTPL
jgi:hypothetical protein